MHRRLQDPAFGASQAQAQFAEYEHRIRIVLA